MTDKYIQLKDASDNNLFPTSDYNNSINIPSINGVPLVGNKSLDELGLFGSGKQLLWSNPNPSVAFAAQTILLSEMPTNYDLLMVFGQYGASSGMRGVGFLNPNETNAQVVIFHYSGYQCSHRQYTISGKNITIGGGYVAYGSTNNSDNTAGIPRQIYGINFKSISQSGEEGTGIETLWTCPYASSARPSISSNTTYQLSKTADFYIVKSSYSKDENHSKNAYSYTLVFDGFAVEASTIGSDGQWIEVRTYTIRGTNFIVGPAYANRGGSATSADPDYCYPLEVYGVNLRPTIVNQYTYSLPGVNNSNLTNLIYPIGSIYTSTSSANPGSIFGGTWEQVNDLVKTAWAPAGSIASNGTLCQLTVEAGTYIIGGYNASTSGALWLRVNDVFQDTNSNLYLRCDYNSGWSKVVTFSADTTICYQNSNGSAITSQVGTQLYAVRIDASGSTVNKWRRIS